MALFAAAARRAATSSLPLLRASVSRAGVAVLRPLDAAVARPMPFSSATPLKPRSTDELPRVTKSETKIAVQCDDHDPDDEDEEQDENSASYSDEPSPSSDESSPSADESSLSSVRNQEKEGEKHPKEHGKHTWCVYEMDDDSSVKFSCTMYPRVHKIVIHALALRPPPPLDEESNEEDGFPKYDNVDFTESEEVVEFSKLDVKLQHALYKLVKPMGCDTPGIRELVQERSCMGKDRDRLLFWETKLWDFLSKEDPSSEDDIC